MTGTHGIVNQKALSGALDFSFIHYLCDDLNIYLAELVGGKLKFLNCFVIKLNKNMSID